MKLLSEYKDEIVETSTAAGWYEDTRSIGEECALLHSEVSEMFEAYRSWGFEDKTLEMCPHEHEETSFDGSHCHPNHLCKPQGVGSEAADVLIRLLDTCNRQDVDVEECWKQAEFLMVLGGLDYMGGSPGDAIEHLHSIITTARGNDGMNIAGMAVSLLVGLVAVSHKWEFDLWDEVERKIAFNRTRAYRHGGKRI